MKEYKIIEIKKEKTLENAQKIMNQMAKEGWEVVSVTYDAWSSLNLQLLITFSMERS